MALAGPRGPITSSSGYNARNVEGEPHRLWVNDASSGDSQSREDRAVEAEAVNTRLRGMCETRLTESWFQTLC